MKPDILEEYYQMLDELPFNAVGSGVVDSGLFRRDDFDAVDYIIEYTCNRIEAQDVIVMNDAMDALRMNCDRLVKVPSERATVDPRGCGNMAMCVNHCCVPNSRLGEVPFGKHVVVMLCALVPLQHGDEVSIEYGYNSLMSHSILICECGHSPCRNII